MSTPSELSIAAAVPKLELAASASCAARSSPGLTSCTTTAPVVAPRRTPQQVCRAKSCKPASCKQMVQTHAPCALDASAADDKGSFFAFPSRRSVTRAQTARRNAAVPMQLSFQTIVANINTNLVEALPGGHSSRVPPFSQPVHHHLPLHSKSQPPKPPHSPVGSSQVQQLQTSLI